MYIGAVPALVGAAVVPASVVGTGVLVNVAVNCTGDVLVNCDVGVKVLVGVAVGGGVGLGSGVWVAVKVALDVGVMVSVGARSCVGTIATACLLRKPGG